MRILHCAYARLPAVSSKLHFRIASRFVIDRYESQKCHGHAIQKNPVFERSSRSRLTRGVPSQIHRRHNASSTDPVVELKSRLPTEPSGRRMNRNLS